MNKIKKTALVILVLSALIFAALYNGLTVRNYIVRSDMFDEGHELTIVLIVDLHNTFHGDNQEKLIYQIKKQKPDLILLAGDMIDRVYWTSGTQILLEGLDGIAPIYYVTGNHEFWTLILL